MGLFLSVREASWNSESEITVTAVRAARPSVEDAVKRDGNLEIVVVGPSRKSSVHKSRSHESATSDTHDVTRRRTGSRVSSFTYAVANV